MVCVFLTPASYLALLRVTHCEKAALLLYSNIFLYEYGVLLLWPSWFVMAKGHNSRGIRDRVFAVRDRYNSLWPKATTFFEVT